MKLATRKSTSRGETIGLLVFSTSPNPPVERANVFINYHRVFLAIGSLLLYPRIRVCIIIARDRNEYVSSFFFFFRVDRGVLEDGKFEDL